MIIDGGSFEEGGSSLRPESSEPPPPQPTIKNTPNFKELSFFCIFFNIFAKDLSVLADPIFV